MSEQVTLFIDGIECKAYEGEYILGTARKNGIFIPAICYLTGCSATLACRLCMVEADGKRVYACNAKVKEGMNVLANTAEISIERNAIMQTYCINHPLECGVCDQSGECELQNFTALMRVNSQKYAIKDTHKPHKNWGKINYDPSLCIVCERCVTVCSDKIGESALKTTPRGGDQPAKELKDSMPKDAFAVWSKFQKSLIAPSAGSNLDCSFCGECTSVCPVGALVGSEFQYSSNAWELNKIPASNPHSSDCELIYYDIKESGIENRKKRIYRVSNDFHFTTLNTAARYGYDFANENAKKDESKFKEIADRFKNGEVKNIKFNSFITNEEALILERLRQKFGLNLVNSEAKKYQDFLNEFAKFSSESLYNGDVESLNKTDFIVSVGTLLRYDSPNISYALNNALKINKSSAIYFHAIVDKVIKNYSKNLLFIHHKAGLELDILLWILQNFAKNLDADIDKFLKENLIISKKIVEILKPKEIEEEIVKKITYENGETQEIKEVVKKQVNEKKEQEISVEVSKFALNLGIDEDRIKALTDKKQSFALIIGEDFYCHENALALAALTGLIAKFTKFKVILIPPRTNSLGVAKICKLSNEESGFSFGYNEKADFTMSISEGDIDAPALTQQEGTFSNYDKRVVPTNAALKYEGYTLNDLANELGIRSKWTIDYTLKLGDIDEFERVEFDELDNFYENSGACKRGYLLKSQKINSEARLDFKNLKSEEIKFNIYRANPIHQFSKFTNMASQLNETGALYVSSGFLDENGFKDGEIVNLKNENLTLAIRLKLDSDLEGVAAYIGDFDDHIDIEPFFIGRYANLKIERA